MKKYIPVLFLLLLSLASYAQTDKDERKQDIRDNANVRKINTKEKVDYNLFHRQLIALKEYSDEKKKIPALQKASKMMVKITTSIDSLDDPEDDAKNKTLTGYITENVGDNSVNVYEVTYDRASKKIISVKTTGETSDVEQEDATDKKNNSKKASAKKTKDDDDDDNANDDKPSKKKSGDED
jgi:hypothetical protein